MQLAAGPEPEEGWLALEGHPFELEEGDVVMDGVYAVMRKAPGQHNNKPATTLVLAYAQEYELEMKHYGNEPEERGRATIPNESLLRWDRQVDEIDWGVESELHQEFLDDTGYEDYVNEWSGMCKDIPSGLLVVFGDKAEPRIVDTAYPTGAVVFADGSVYQSHPNREWVGWLKPEHTARPLIGVADSR